MGENMSSESESEIVEESEEQASTDELNQASGQEESSAEEEIRALQEKIAELEDGRLRMAAEMQNTRKRLEKQRLDEYKYRHQDILRDIAEVIDNLERAIVSSEETGDFQTFREGIDLIEKQFTSMLAEKYSFERFGEIGWPFDPACHEAIALEESAEVEEEQIKQVFQAGYRLHDRVLRSARVAVIKPLQAGETPETVSNENIDNEGDI
ncbi:MAG: nucleotide exchange factor GrpE [Spirochaeta sp. LUC14_002_19_P3]|nr:MAG: nucleotide exchange factor GrpE [Spirochaeta sp. LUC14_002_19_P3]